MSLTLSQTDYDPHEKLKGPFHYCCSFTETLKSLIPYVAFHLAILSGECAHKIPSPESTKCVCSLQRSKIENV